MSTKFEFGVFLLHKSMLAWTVVYAVIIYPSVWCGCSVPVDEWLDSYAVDIAHLAHAAGESIFCQEGWWRGYSQMILGRTCWNVQ